MTHTASPDTAGVRYPASMDQHITEHAAQLAAMTNATEIRAWFAANGQDIGTSDPWCSVLGRLQADARALLGIIDRQREEIEQLRALSARQAAMITELERVCAEVTGA